VTDSPLLLSSIYFDYYIKSLKKPLFTHEYIELSKQFFEQTFMQFENRVYLLRRVKEYDTNGRNQTLDEAKELDQVIERKLLQIGVPYVHLHGDELENIDSIMKMEGVMSANYNNIF
jgi:hypothetical protein